ncbi:MAG: tetratricopeptide repeat protein [Oscillospiraceae bacterium]|nr:tetratricopeptide repeat protein [Oscillospiraceae bacterium]
MNYESLSLSGFIDEMKDVSKGPHQRKFCFVLGAGASRSSGIKSGQELVDAWDKELTVRNREGHLKWKSDKGITDENKYSFYSQYYDRRFSREPGDGYNYLEKLMEHAKPSAGYVMLAHLLTKTPHNVVVTTNFDHLIEDAVNYYSQEIPLVIGHEALAHYILKHTTRPTIVKIHRDLLLAPKSQTKELEKLHENWEKSLDVIFSEYHPVFIGYAGNDKSLMDFLIKNSEKFEDGTWRFPYWMLYKTNSLTGKILEFVNKANGYVIEHDGFDKTLYLIGTKFEYVMPNEEVFLADAKRRYQSLSISIDEFTEKYSSEAEAFDGGDSSSDEDKKSDIDQAIRQVTDKSELLSMYRTAVTLHKAGKYDKALTIEQSLVERDPDNALYQNSLGVTLHKMGRYDEALAAFQKAVELEPDNARYQNNLGGSLHEKGRYDEALAAKQKAVELEPDNALYWKNLGITLHEKGRYDEALVALQKAVELEPDNARYQESLGITLHAMGRYDEALAAKQKAVELEPDNARYQDSLGITLHEMGRYADALIPSQKAVELDPDNARYHDSLGVTLHEMGRYAEALAAKQKAVELEPDNALYQDDLSVTFHEMGRYADALISSQKAIELEPDNAQYQNSLGITLHEMGRYADALISSQKAVELESDNARYQHSLGVTLHKMGRYAEALAAKQKAVELEPDNARYQDSLEITLRKMG